METDNGALVSKRNLTYSKGLSEKRAHGGGYGTLHAHEVVFPATAEEAFALFRKHVARKLQNLEAPTARRALILAAVPALEFSAKTPAKVDTEKRSLGLLLPDVLNVPVWRLPHAGWRSFVDTIDPHFALVSAVAALRGSCEARAAFPLRGLQNRASVKRCKASVERCKCTMGWLGQRLTVSQKSA